MFAVITVPDFPLHAWRRLDPTGRGGPMAVVAGEGRRARVVHHTADATGVAVGLTATQALAECPAVRLVAPSAEAEREAGAWLLNAGWSIAPMVEATAPGQVTVDLAGVDPLRLRRQLPGLRAGLAAAGLPARVGVAANPLLAAYAARAAAPDTDCWVDDARDFLRTRPVAWLGLTEDEARLLGDLGLHTLGALTAFPRAALANRLGRRGDELWARAAGDEHRPIHPVPPPVRHRAELALEEPVETLEPLLFVVRRLCDRLAREVGRFGGGTARMELVLRLDDERACARGFDLPEPTANADLLFAVLENHLAALRTDAPVTGLALEVFPARRHHVQAGLFDTGLKDAPRFYATLGRLAAVVGSGNVGTPRRADTHRPDAFALQPPAALVPERTPPAAPAPCGPCLRRLRPPRPATVGLESARPVYVVSAVAEGAVEVVRGPFWSGGDWWADAWVREEWDVRIGDGLHRLLHEPGGWFIEGSYD